jgi:Outer membrane protein beta-barrel domain
MRTIRWLFVALALLLASPAAAAEVDLGVISGFSFSNLKIEGQSGLEGISTFAAGAVIDIGFNDRFGMRVEPMWVTKGSKATHRNAYWGTIDGAEFKIDCIDVPVLARYDLAASDTHGYLLGGLGFSFALEQEAKLSVGNNSATADFGDVFNPVDVALDLGLGVSVPVGISRMTFDGRAAIGLLDINGGGTVTFSGTPMDVPSTSTHSLDFRLLATYMFPTGTK